MTDIADYFDKYDNITEVHEIVRTLEIVRDGKDRFRLEVKRRYQGKDFDYYDVMGWRYDGDILVRQEIPWLNVDTADFALSRAINYIATGDI